MLSLLIPPREANGQPLCDQPAVSYRYDCSTTPELAPEGAWTALDAWTYYSTWYSDGERLHILAFEDNGSAGFYRVEETLSLARAASLEVTAGIDRHGPLGWAPTIFVGFGLSDGEKVVLVWPGGLPEDGRVAVNWQNLVFSALGATDWSPPAGCQVPVLEVLH